MVDKMTLIIIAADEYKLKLECDSVRLTVSDNKLGKAGGSYGIKPGHANAILALADGKTEAFLGGKCIFKADTSAGFAKIEKGTVTLITEKCSPTE